MEFTSIELGPIGTNCIIAFDKKLGRALVFDAPGDAYKLAQAFAKQHDLKIEALLLTHGHWDHILDSHHFKAAGIPIYAHKDDQFLLENPEKMASYALPGVTFEAVEVDTWLEPDEVVTFLEKLWEVRHVPGHCPGSLLFYNAETETAIVGDAIFAGSVGRTDLPGGDFGVLQTSIRGQIYTLPESTRLFPGHGPETSVGGEKASNPFVRV